MSHESDVLDGIKIAFDALSDSLDGGGYSAGRIVELIRVKGVVLTVSDLHGHGLQELANAIAEAAQLARSYPEDG